MIHLDIQGTRLPALGLGTYPLRGADATDAVERALRLGYRHIDTAQSYENEREVGAALRRSGVPRDEIFLVTKVRPGNFERRRVRASTEESLRKLAVDAIDLLLLHWPDPEVPVGETLEALRTLQDEGRVRHLGVSNFPTGLVTEAAQHADIFANQVEYHPYLNQGAVLAQARAMGHMVTAYSPIARGRVNQEPIIQEIAAAHGKNPVQVTLRWLLQQDRVAAIPKSGNPERQAANFDVFDFELSAEEMASIDGIGGRDRIVEPDSAPDWD